MPHQPYFKESFVHQLFGEVELNLPRYRQNEPWVPEYAPGAAYELLSRIEVPGGLALAMPDEVGKKDLENTKILYGALRKLTPTQATDQRLWTYMTHLTFWPYMRKRWCLEESNTKEVNHKDYVLTHYFVRSQESRALLRSGISRLWWYGFLTYDEDRSNPYELTGVLLQQLDIAQQILERSLGRNRDILHAFLTFLLEHPDLASGGDQGRATIRTIAKRLNLHGGLCVLDSLDGSDIKRWLEDALVNVQRAPVA